MSHSLQNDEAEDKITEHRRLISGVSKAVEIHYAQVLETAKKEWERNCSKPDPSDDCVSVRISASDPQKPSLPCAGVRRKQRRSFLNGNGRPLQV
jgi:hypothetical protein